MIKNIIKNIPCTPSLKINPTVSINNFYMALDNAY